ncbi:acyltransferase [Vibrio vulnificus]|uniref:acyltransferase n=1 Tax=Vibrio vulnificus TaxID=672 RepID=UPI000721DD97|nr:acyltransferase [Vibrio vulnificus]ALM72128.1 Galactoside O-acetyltransferase [Vibrio vulnificus]ANH62069.1 Galactoside O-acetyltransferase [Vibrio vulnificus]
MLQDKINLLLKSSIVKSIFYSLKYKGLILASRTVKIKSKGKARIIIPKNKVIKIGLEYDSTIEKVNIVLEEHSTINFLGSASIKKGVQISLGKNALLCIGDKTYINENTKIFVYDKCTIGDKCAISWNVTITDSNVHTLNNNAPSEEVFVGDNVWIGFGSSILKGSRIESGSVIAAGAVVNNKFGSKNLLAGNPAKVIKENVEWE